MKYTSKYKILVIALILSSCGGAGHVRFYDFIAPKADVKKELIRVINTNGNYSAPAHWNNYELGTDSSNDIFIYFKENPKELYLVQFNDYDDQPEYKDKTVLALVGVFDGKVWHFARDLSRSEELRLDKRLQNEILSKLRYSYHEN